MRKSKQVLAAMAGLFALGSAAQLRAEGLATSVRYSALVAPGEGEAIHGWQVSLAPSRSGWGVALDGGGYHAGGSGVYALMAGPRWASRPGAGGVSGFVQVLAGGVVVPGEALVFAAHPGFGVDFRADKPLGVRLQADWPIITAGGVIAQVPRLSAGLVWRPRASRTWTSR